MKLSAARAVVTRKANAVELPADHPFAVATSAALSREVHKPKPNARTVRRLLSKCARIEGRTP